MALASGMKEASTKEEVRRLSIGFLRIDLDQVRIAKGKLYRFFAINRTSKFVVVELVEGADMQAAKISGGACQSRFKSHSGGAHRQYSFKAHGGVVEGMFDSGFFDGAVQSFQVTVRQSKLLDSRFHQITFDPIHQVPELIGQFRLPVSELG
jgi:hypothetical protein